MVNSEVELRLCQTILSSINKMVADGLVDNTSGNISARAENSDEMIITPGSYSYEKTTLGDLVKVDINTLMRTRGFRLASSESPMHAAIYRGRTDVGGIVHTHSRYATAWSTLCRPIPAIHYVVSSIGNEVPVTGYHTYGSADLAEEASEVLQTHNATLLQNHGVIAVGSSLADALKNAIRVEFLAQEILLTAGLGAHILTPHDLDLVREQGVKKRLAR